MMTDAEARTPQEQPQRGSRRRLLLTCAAVVVVAWTVGTVTVVRSGSDRGAPTGPTTATAPVVRTDLASRAQIDGLLSYSGTYTVISSAGGRVTWLPAVGAVLRRGQRVYGRDGHSVPLFYSPSPFWRPLHTGMTDGADVLALERNLSALGYGSGMTVDRHFGYATAVAVKRWQDDLGAPKTGEVQPDDAVVQPGALRVTALQTLPGNPAQGQILTASGTARQVIVQLPVAQQQIVRKGAAVRVRLPGGKLAPGHVLSIGSVASSGTSGGSGQEQAQTGQATESATLPVTITLDKASDAGGLAGAPVTVEFTTKLDKAVLAVPVQALLASPDGSYSVRIVDVQSHKVTVPVRLGLFSDGFVGVTGNLSEGQKVEVPTS
jgi:peptidoglycan hydrolase-like protein with peptidoglycan-binding domain